MIRYTLLLRHAAKSCFISVTETLSFGLLGPLTDDTTVDKSKVTISLNIGSCPA